MFNCLGLLGCVFSCWFWAKPWPPNVSH